MPSEKLKACFVMAGGGLGGRLNSAAVHGVTCIASRDRDMSNSALGYAPLQICQTEAIPHDCDFLFPPFSCTRYILAVVRL